MKPTKAPALGGGKKAQTITAFPLGVYACLVKTKQNTTQHNATQRNATQRNATQHTTQHNATQHSTTQRNATQHHTTQRNTTQHMSGGQHRERGGTQQHTS